MFDSQNEIYYKGNSKMISLDIENIKHTNPIYKGIKYILYDEKYDEDFNIFLLTDKNNNLLFYIKYYERTNGITLHNRENLSNIKGLFFKIVYTLLYKGYSITEDFQHNDLSIKSIKKIIQAGVIDVYYNKKKITQDIIDNNFDDNDINKTFTYEMSNHNKKYLLENNSKDWVGEDIMNDVEFLIKNTNINKGSEMNLENESKEFLDFLVEHCEANKIEEINEDELEDLKEQFINEAIKIEDVEALLGAGKPNGKYTKFTLKDGTYVLYHPTIGLEYRAKDGSLLPHNWKTVKAMKKELVMAGMINESDNKKMIESLLFKIKAKYGYDNLKVDYENGVVTGADEDIKFDVSGDNDYVELIETLQRMLKFGDEEVNEAKNKSDNEKLIFQIENQSLLYDDYRYSKNENDFKSRILKHKEYLSGKWVKKGDEVNIDNINWKLVYNNVEMLDEAKNKSDNGVYLGREVKLKDGIYTIISCNDKSGKNQDCLLMKNNQPSKEVEEFITKEMLLPLNEAIEESNITTALREIANGNTGAGIEAFKSAFLDRLSLNQDFQRITSELK